MNEIQLRLEKKNIKESFNQYTKYKMKTPYKTEIKPTIYQLGSQRWKRTGKHTLQRTKWHPCETPRRGFPPPWPTPGAGFRANAEPGGASRNSSCRRLRRRSFSKRFRSSAALTLMHSCSHLVSPF